MTDWLAHNWLWLALTALSALVIVLWASSKQGPVARQVYGQFVFLIAVPLFVLFGVAFGVLALVADLSDDMWTALIAGSVLASGWLASAIFGQLGRAQEKEERLRDYHKALYAEIGNSLRAMWDEGRSGDITRAIIDRMKADKDFVPFIPREHHDHVFNALMDEIEVLPRQTIDAIVAYYILMKSIDALAEDMRGDRFAVLEQDRRIAIYSDFSEMREQAFRLGQYALRLIKVYASEGAEAASRLAGLNTPAAGRSGPSTGSE